jgi:hypothetical protein
VIKASSTCICAAHRFGICSGIGQGKVRESLVVKNGIQPYVYSGDSSVGRVVEGLIVLQ